MPCIYLQLQIQYDTIQQTSTSLLVLFQEHKFATLERKVDKRRDVVEESLVVKEENPKYMVRYQLTCVLLYIVIYTFLFSMKD